MEDTLVAHVSCPAGFFGKVPSARPCPVPCSPGAGITGIATVGEGAEGVLGTPADAGGSGGTPDAPSLTSFAERLARERTVDGRPGVAISSMVLRASFRVNGCVDRKGARPPGNTLGCTTSASCMSSYSSSSAPAALFHPLGSLGCSPMGGIVGMTVWLTSEPLLWIARRAAARPAGSVAPGVAPGVSPLLFPLLVL